MNRALSVLSLLLASAVGAQASPITYASAVTFTPLETSVFTTVGGSTTADTAKAAGRADFGAVGVSVTGAESFAAAAWLDEWTVTGGTGTGTLTVNWELEGTISLLNGVCSGCVADPGVVSLRSLYGSSAPTSAGSLLYELSHTNAIVSMSGSFDYAFTYGQMFTAGFRLNGSLIDDFYGGSLDFLNTAILTSVIVPAGARLTTTSGTEYVVATAPEPASLLLLATGLLGAGVRRWRQKRR